MPHIREEGCLQSIALLGLITSENQSILHILSTVYTHGSTHYLQGIPLTIALSDSRITLLPVRLARDERFDLILLIKHIRFAYTYLVKSLSHLGLVIGEKLEYPVIDIGISLWKVVACIFPVVIVESHRPHLGINMPGGQTHGFQDKLIFHITLHHLTDFRQIILQLPPLFILTVNQK